MHALTIASRCRRYAASASLALFLPVTGLAADNVPPEALSVKIYPDRFVAAGKPITDLAALEAWATPILIRSVWLDVCGTVPTRQLVAAVGRLHARYPEGIQLRTLPSGDAACASAAGPARPGSMQSDLASASAGHLAVDSLGRGRLP